MRTYADMRTCVRLLIGPSWGVRTYVFPVPQRLALGEMVDPGSMSGRWRPMLFYMWEADVPSNPFLVPTEAFLVPDVFAGMHDGATAPGYPAVSPGPPGLPPPQLSRSEEGEGGKGCKGNQPAAAAEAAKAANVISQQLPSSGGKGGEGHEPSRRHAPGGGRPGQAPCIERRLAADHRGYTWQEFQIYYGDNAGDFWQSAPPDPSAERDYHRLLRRLEHNRKLLRAAAPHRGPSTKVGALREMPYVPLIDDFNFPEQDPISRAHNGVDTSGGAD